MDEAFKKIADEILNKRMALLFMEMDRLGQVIQNATFAAERPVDQSEVLKYFGITRSTLFTWMSVYGFPFKEPVPRKKMFFWSDIRSWACGEKLQAALEDTTKRQIKRQSKATAKAA